MALEQKCNGNMCQLTLLLIISTSDWLSKYIELILTSDSQVGDSNVM